MTTTKYTIMVGEILQKVDDAKTKKAKKDILTKYSDCLLYTSPSPRDRG